MTNIIHNLSLRPLFPTLPLCGPISLTANRLKGATERVEVISNFEAASSLYMTKKKTEKNKTK